MRELKAATEGEGAQIEFVAPRIGGAEASDGTWIEAKQKVDGGSSVLYDAVAIVVSDDGAQALSKLPPARDFVTDAFTHCKFIAYSGEAALLFERTGLASNLDEGGVRLEAPAQARDFIQQCGRLRVWERESKLWAQDWASKERVR